MASASRRSGGRCSDPIKGRKGYCDFSHRMKDLAPVSSKGEAQTSFEPDAVHMQRIH
jgi:hypothetical protein